MALENSQSCSIYEEPTSSPQGLHSTTSLGLFGYKSQHNLMLKDEELNTLRSYSGNLLPMLSDHSTNSASTSYAFGAMSSTSSSNYLKDYCAYSSPSSLLSFDHSDQQYNEDECAWIDSMDSNYQQSVSTLELKRTTSDSWLISDDNCYDVSTKDKQFGEDKFNFLYHGANAMEGIHESRSIEQRKCNQNRTNMDSDDMPSPKKQCGIARKTKEKCSPSKDPQSIAAKNRRERISERLKILQDLVPNGTKVDLVTMLEKAISYVKFLQLQVKVLATDEFWPEQGGKAPEISQVKEAIDAILSSNKDRINSNYSHQ